MRDSVYGACGVIDANTVLDALCARSGQLLRRSAIRRGVDSKAE